VEAHGGRITAMSDGPGTGTTMVVVLPLAMAVD
jgi:signal transduction histidine kinase